MYIRNNFGVMTENQQDKFVSLEAKVRVLIEKFEAEVEKNKELNAKISEVEMRQLEIGQIPESQRRTS